MGCVSSSPPMDDIAIVDPPVPVPVSNEIKRTITLTTITAGLVKKVSLRSSSPLESMDEELLLSKHGLYYTILNTSAVIDVDTCELIGHLDIHGLFHKEINDHVKDVASQHKLVIRE